MRISAMTAIEGNSEKERKKTRKRNFQRLASVDWRYYNQSDLYPYHITD